MLKRILSVALLTAMPALGVFADEAAEAVLEENGLSRQGSTYLLEGEGEVTRARREMQAAQRELTSAERDYRDVERRIARAQSYIAALQQEVDELRSQARRSDTRREYDRHVTAIEEKSQEIEQAQEERQAYEDEQQALIDDARANFLTILFEVAGQAQEVADAYTALAEDEAVSEAIATMSEEDDKNYQLGPSRAFENVQRQLAVAAEEYSAGVVDLRNEGNVLMVDVRINGNPVRSMILDTGASSISLPFAFAKDLGIEPSETTPTVRVQMADGKIVEAWQMTLETVLVGQFLVEDVECLVLPEELHAAPALLGNSFLANFTFKVDPERGKLLLSRIERDEDEEDED